MGDAPPRARSADAALRIGQGEIRLWSLPFTIGRSSGNTLTLKNQQISRTHCQIDKVDGAYQITSLAEKKPVVVNGNAIQRYKLRDGDEIEIDEHRFVFALIGDEPETGVGVVNGGSDGKPVPDPERATLPADPAPPAVAAAASMGSMPAAPAPAPPPHASVAPAAHPGTIARARPAAAGGGVLVGGILGALLVLGLLCLGALSLHQSRQQTLRRRDAFVALKTEINALAQSVENSRQQYLIDEEATQRAWQQMFEEQQYRAAAADPPRPTSRPRPVGTAPRQPDPPVKQPDPPVKQPDPPVKQPDPPVKQPDPPVKQPDPPVPTPIDPDPQPLASSGLSFFHHKIRPTKIAIVVDKSAGMAKDLPRVVEQLEALVDALGAEHQFTMTFFDASPRVFSRSLVPADERHKGLAKRFVRTQVAGGPAQALPVLQAAFDLKEVEALVFVTAGAISDAEADWLDKLLKTIVDGKLDRPLLVYLWSPAPTPRLEKLIKLAGQQRF